MIYTVTLTAEDGTVLNTYTLASDAEEVRTIKAAMQVSIRSGIFIGRDIFDTVHRHTRGQGNNEHLD